MLPSLLALLLALAPASPLQSQIAEALELPDSAPGRIAKAYVDAYNSGESEMQVFFDRNASAESLARTPIPVRIERYRMIRGDLGTIAVVRVLLAEPASIRLLCKAERGQWAAFEFQLDPQPPHKLAGIRIEPVDSPEAATIEPAKSDEAMVEAVARRIDELAARDAFSGTVFIVKNGTPLLQKTVGLASREHGVPNRLDTRFNLGSINKLFTMVSICQLIEAGKLKPTDTIGSVLPDYPNRDAAAKVTVHQLLTMRSGIGDFFNERFESTPRNAIRTTSDYMKLFADKPLEFEPGTDNRYSNGGFVVLGAIVEKLSGASYFDYVRDHVYKPAGMTATDSFPSDAVVPNLASGYTRENPSVPWRNNVLLRPGRGSSAGGGYSTAADLAAFADALTEARLMSPSATAWMLGGFETQAPVADARPGGGAAGWGGGAEGINSALEVDFDRGYVIVVMSNMDPPAAVSLAGTISHLLPRK